jgi:hypothetical protein
VLHLPVSGTPAEIAPQAKAHIGGNQVTGLSNSSTAAGCGQERIAPIGALTDDTVTRT